MRVKFAISFFSLFRVLLALKSKKIEILSKKWFNFENKFSLESKVTVRKSGRECRRGSALAKEREWERESMREKFGLKFISPSFRTSWLTERSVYHYIREFVTFFHNSSPATRVLCSQFSIIRENIG